MGQRREEPLLQKIAATAKPSYRSSQINKKLVGLKIA